MPSRDATEPPLLAPLDAASLDEGDLRDLAPRVLVDSLRFDDLSIDELDLAGTRFRDVVLDRVHAPVVKAARSDWSDVRVTGRLGSIEAYDAAWRSVHFLGCKLGFVNLRGAELTDVAFTDCQVEELDLVGATLRRVALVDTRLALLDVQHAKLTDVDLRGADVERIDGILDLKGATVTAAQLTLLAPVLAAGLGLKIEVD